MIANGVFMQNLQHKVAVYANFVKSTQVQEFLWGKRWEEMGQGVSSSGNTPSFFEKESEAAVRNLTSI